MCLISFNVADGRIEFGTFLELMYQHSQVEKCQQDILAAFKAHDKHGRGTVPANELVHILSNFGEKLSRAEGEKTITCKISNENNTLLL